MNPYEVLEKVVKAKLDITPRIQKELQLLSEAPDFIPEAMLKAYQEVVLDGKQQAQAVNECHSEIAYELGLTTTHPGDISFHYPVKPGALPDIDTDFAFPDKVKDYIREKYGADHVVGIPTYGKYKFRGLLTDLCRVLRDEDGDELVSMDEVKALNKKLPFKLDQQVAVDMADDDEENQDDELFSNPDIQEFQHKYPRVFKHFKELYATPKYRGQHAAGTVILPAPARDTLPLSNNKKSLCTEWIEGQGVAELGSVGVIKIDILGLKTLKILDTANRLVMQRYSLEDGTPSPCACKKQGVPCETNHVLPFATLEATGEKMIDLNLLCLNIPAVYKSIANFETQGVFQFEPEGISGFTHKYSPRQFYDLALISALYRPGPLDARLDDDGMPIDPEDAAYKSAPSAAMVFIDRYNGRKKVLYASPKLSDVLDKSYGIAVFQEDISRIVMKMTNCGFAEAEKVRKFLTKVKPEALKSDEAVIKELKDYEDNFMTKSMANGATHKEAQAVWNLIVPFARYGFNKAHAVAYSLISYMTGFFRTLFPLEWLTALMIHNIENTDKLLEYVRTAQKLEYTVQPPDLNKSEENFIIDEDDKIRGGLCMIKGVGEKAATLVVADLKANGPFQSLEDFLARPIRWQVVKIDVLEALTKAGALDSISPNRQLTWVKIQIAKKKAWIENDVVKIEVIDKKTLKKEEKVIAQVVEIDGEKQVVVEDWSTKEKLKLERELFGFLLDDYVTKNKESIERYRKKLRELAVQKKKQETIGTIDDIKEADQKNGQKYARIFVTNVDGIKEQWLCFASVWNVYKHTVKPHETFFALGRKDEKSFIVDGLYPLDEVIKKLKD